MVIDFGSVRGSFSNDDDGDDVYVAIACDSANKY